MPSLLRLRALPWLALIDVARTTKAHLDDHLTDRDRRRVAEIARRTKGNPRLLTDRERADLKRIARDLNAGRLARDLGPSLVGLRRRGRR
jgi:hypothetical protein